MGSVWTTDEGIQRRSTWAVRDGDGCCELNKVGRGHVAVLLERADECSDFVKTLIGVKFGLHVGEKQDGTIGTSTTVLSTLVSTARRSYEQFMCAPKFALSLESRGERDGVVERQAECDMGDVITLCAVEKVLLEVIADGE